MAKNKPLPQGDFLRDAMMRLGMKTIDEFAERLGTPKRTLENWLASPDSSSYRTMPEIAWKFVREILQNARGRGVIGF